MSDTDQCAAGTPKTELERVREELDLMKSAGVIEVATRNSSVWDFVQDREARIADLERQLAEARGEFRKGWRFAYNQWERTGSVPNPDYTPDPFLKGTP